MVQCLIDLGLQCSEAVNLRLEDIDWTDGTISLIGSKGRRADVPPLPITSGLKNGRPIGPAARAIRGRSQCGKRLWGRRSFLAG